MGIVISTELKTIYIRNSIRTLGRLTTTTTTTTTTSRCRHFRHKVMQTISVRVDPTVETGSRAESAKIVTKGVGIGKVAGMTIEGITTAMTIDNAATPTTTTAALRPMFNDLDEKYCLLFRGPT
jgi:hypothetical protein